MTSFLRWPARLVAPAIAVAGLLASAGPAAAGWDNVFQVSCNDCKSKPRTSYYSAPAPQPEKHVEYQRSYYYEPITVMKPERFTEEVPVQVKSYYWDPVTSYTYKSYYDPCSGCSQQIAVPRTSYVRKEQCSTITKYVERVRMVPTQVQRKVEVTRPVVTYYLPEQRRYVPDCELPGAGGANPRVDEMRAPPSVFPDSGTGTIPPTRLPVTEQSRQKLSPAPARPTTVNAHTASRASAGVRGEVVLNDQNTPRPGAKVVFVSAKNTDVREFATADQFGNFDVKLDAGDWYLYLGNGEGKATMHKKITVGEYESREFKVVSR